MLYSILAQCMKAMRKNKFSNDKIEEFMNEAKSGDYNHLLATCMEWFDVT